MSRLSIAQIANNSVKKLTTIALTVISALAGIFPSEVLIVISRSVLLLFGYRKQVINNNYIRTRVSSLKGSNDKTFYKKNIHYLARLITESLRPLRSDKVDLVTYIGVEQMLASSRASDGLILLASHYGNWELACSLLPLHTDMPVYGVYKPLKNQGADEYMRKRRSVYGLNLVPMKRIGRVITNNVREKTPAIYILIADQNPNSKNSIIWKDFLGVRSAFFNGPAKILDKYPLSASYMNVAVGAQTYAYEIEIESLEVGAANTDIIDQYAALLSTNILNAPQYWLWSHKRWKRNF